MAKKKKHYTTLFIDITAKVTNEKPIDTNKLVAELNTVLSKYTLTRLKVENYVGNDWD